MATVSRHSIIWKLTRYVVGIALLCGIIFSILQISFDFQSEKKRSNTIVEQIIQGSLPIAVEVVYKLDSEGAAEFVEGLLNYDFIGHASLYADDGSILAEKKKSVNHQSNTAWLTAILFSEHKELRRNLIKGDNHYSYGTLYVQIDHDSLYRELYKRSTSVFLSGVFRNLIVSFIVLAVFYFVLARPLSEIAGFFGGIDPENSKGERLPVPEKHKHNEIGEITRKANMYLDNSDAHIEQMYKARREIEKNSEYLRNILQTTAEGFIYSDSDEIIRDTNPSMLTILGRSEEQVCGKNSLILSRSLMLKRLKRSRSTIIRDITRHFLLHLYTPMVLMFLVQSVQRLFWILPAPALPVLPLSPINQRR